MNYEIYSIFINCANITASAIILFRMVQIKNHLLDTQNRIKILENELSEAKSRIQIKVNSVIKEIEEEYNGK